MTFDIAVKVTPELAATSPEYADIDVLVLVTVYTEFMSKMLAKVLTDLSVDGTEILILPRDDDDTTKIGVLVDD